MPPCWLASGVTFEDVSITPPKTGKTTSPFNEAVKVAIRVRQIPHKLACYVRPEKTKGANAARVVAVEAVIGQAMRFAASR